MGEPTFRDFDPGHDRAALIALLATEHWAHRTRPVYSQADVIDELDRGYYAGRRRDHGDGRGRR
jgi:hypothetical protein